MFQASGITCAFLQFSKALRLSFSFFLYSSSRIYCIQKDKHCIILYSVSNMSYSILLVHLHSFYCFLKLRLCNVQIEALISFYDFDFEEYFSD